MAIEDLKFAVNSTIGTARFKPLDLLIGLKNVQRGIAAAAGNVTISAIDPSKAFVLSVSKGSAGTVAATGTVAAHGVSGNITGTLSGTVTYADNYSGNIATRINSGPAGTAPVSVSGTRSLSGTAAAAAISGGTTDLTVKEYSARLVNGTTLYCDGPCEWQIVEFK